MPIEAKEALEVFGVTDLAQFDTVDAFKEAIEKDWLKAATAHNNPAVKAKVVGTFHRAGAKKIGDLNAALDLGLEIDDKADLLDLIPKLSDALKPKFEGIKELQEKVKNAAPAEALAEFDSKLKEKDKKLSAFEKDAAKWKGEYEALFNTVQTREKTAKVDGEWSGALKSVPFATTVDDLKKEGFEAKMRKEIQILIDDEGKPYAANAKGEPYMHPKKAAERWPLPDILRAKAEELKLVGTNPQGGKVITTVAKPHEQEAPPGRFAQRRQADRIM